MAERIHRALTQRLILLHENINEETICATYDIMGSQGRKYRVTILPDNECTCTCMDFSLRQRRCKHIYFALINALGFTTNQVRFAISEQSLSDHLRARVQRLSNIIPLISDEHKVSRKPINGEDCPICLEPMDETTDSIIWCKNTCGNNVHETCLLRWSANNIQPSCPLCRCVWE